MASSSACSSIASTLGSSLFYRKPFSELPSPSLLLFSRSLRPSHFTPLKTHGLQRRRKSITLRAATGKVKSRNLRGSIYEDEEESEEEIDSEEEFDSDEGIDSEEEIDSEERFDLQERFGSRDRFDSEESFGLGDELFSLPGWGMMPLERKETPPCPPGLREYETMAILRPEMSEDERLALTQKYEELLVAGGGMYVEVYNRGIIPLCYDISRRNKDGELNTYSDGIYLIFTYFTKPESIEALETELRTDDNVIRSTTFREEKRMKFLRRKENVVSYES